jgi:hypothetical protein
MKATTRARPTIAARLPLRTSSSPRLAPHLADLPDGDRRRQRSGAEHELEVLRLLVHLLVGLPGGAAHGDAGPAIGNPLVDARSGVHVVVEDDGHVTAHVVPGELPELDAALGVEGEVDLEVVGGLTAAGVRAGQTLAGERDGLVHQEGEVAVTGGGLGLDRHALEEDLPVVRDALAGVGEQLLAVLPLQLLVAVGADQPDAGLRRGRVGRPPAG